MALTRKFLKAMKLEDEVIEQIIEAHGETVAALKTERDEFKDKAADYDEVLKQRDELKKAADEAAKGEHKDEYKVKYEAVKQEFDKYKAEIHDKEIKTARDAAYIKQLRAEGVSDKRTSSVLRISDLSQFEFDEAKGEFKDPAAVTKYIQAEFSDYKETITETGTPTANPPANTQTSAFDAMTLGEKMVYANKNSDAPEVKAWLGKT